MLAPNVQTEMLATLRRGLSGAAAAARAGIGARALCDAMVRVDGAEPCAPFRVAVEAAGGVCKAQSVAVLFKTALADRDQVRRLPEQRFPGSWGRRSADPERVPESSSTGVTAFLHPQFRPRCPPGSGIEATTPPRSEFSQLSQGGLRRRKARRPPCRSMNHHRVARMHPLAGTLRS